MIANRRQRLAAVVLIVASGRLALAQGTAGAPAPPQAPATGRGGASRLEQLIDRTPPERIQDRAYPFKEAGGLYMPYSLFVPKGYDPSRKSPLVVDLHGDGISAVNQIRFQGTTEFAEQDGFIVVAPTGYSVRAFWGIPGRGSGLVAGEPGFENEKALKTDFHQLSYLDTMNVIGLVRREFNIDEKHIFLMGHSMGGAGAYYLAAKHPEMWAGVAAISGGGINDSYAPGDRLKAIPFFVMQGEKDPIVNADASRASVAKMKELGMKYVYVEIPGARHEEYIRHTPLNMGKVFAFFNSLR